MSAKLTATTSYPLADPIDEREKHVFGDHPKARWTGDKRRPLKGEWYLSGTIIEAYRAPEHLQTLHQIARLTRH